MKVRKRLILAAALLAALVAVVLLRGGPGPAPLLSDAVARPLHGAPGVWAIEAKIDNRGGWDILRAARSPDAAAVTVVGGSDGGVALPAGSTPALSLDGVFLRLEGLSGAAEDGRLVPVTLSFARAGDVSARVRLATQTAGGAMAHAMPGHADPLDLPAAQAPRLGLTLRPDGDGWIAALELAGLTLSAEAADSPHVPGKGHAHLYLGGLKLQRMYGPTARIGALPPGQHVVRVTLNTNDHRPYAAAGTPIEALALIDQPQ